LKVDLTSDLLPAPRLRPDATGAVWVEAYTDFKLHDICGPGGAESLDMNQSQWAKKFKEGNCRFLTKRLWGAANEPPFFHHGLFTTLRQSVLAHSGEAQRSREAFQSLPAAEQDAVIEFLKTLQVLPPGTGWRVVDENYRPREWPPQTVTQAGVRTEQRR
jgi:cytochrome c peroxidase